MITLIAIFCAISSYHGVTIQSKIPTREVGLG